MRITKALLSLALVASTVDARSWITDAGMYLFFFCFDTLCMREMC